MKRAAARSPLLSTATLRARGCPFPTRPLQAAYAPRRARLSPLPSGKHQWGLGLPLHRGPVVARRRSAVRHGDSSIEARSPDANGATKPGMHGGCTPSTARAELRGKPVAPCRAGNLGCVWCVRRRPPAGISRAVMQADSAKYACAARSPGRRRIERYPVEIASRIRNDHGSRARSDGAEWEMPTVTRVA